MPKSSKNYILNVASYQNGIGNKKDWTTISGFAEASIDFIRELEGYGLQFQILRKLELILSES